MTQDNRKDEAQAPSRTRYFHELDSLRGLAALAVVLGHYANLFLVDQGPYPAVKQMIEVAQASPLFVLMAGHEAVMLFFVLSGFVLSLQFFKGTPVHYKPFVIKRLFRIYVPYLAVITLAIFACGALYNGPISEFGTWFNHPWSTPITRASVLNHLVFLIDFKSDQYDPVLWSLVHELRVSLAFPLLMMLVLKLNSRQNVVLSTLLSFFGIAAALAWKSFSGHDSDTGYARTFHYAGVFVLGVLLARNKDAAVSWYRARPFSGRVLIGAAGFFLYCYGHRLPGALNYFSDIPIAWGASLLVLTALGSRRTSSVLYLRPIRFLGRISYSLYLLHTVILLAFVHLLYGKAPLPVLLGLSAATSLLLAHFSYVGIESPAMDAGKKFAELNGTPHEMSSRQCARK